MLEAQKMGKNACWNNFSGFLDIYLQWSLETENLRNGGERIGNAEELETIWNFRSYVRENISKYPRYSLK